jgi:hypothetical protein
MPTPNPDEAAGIITHFYRDLDTGTTASYADAATIVTPDFLRDHHDDWFMDYGYISSPRVEIKGVSDRDVSYAVDYIYKGTAGNLYWERNGDWRLNRGRAGWLLDRDTWSAIHLVGFTTSPSGPMIPVKDRTFSDGHHEFDYQGLTYTFMATNKTWSMKVIPPSPPPGFGSGSSAVGQYQGSGETEPQSGQGYAAPYAAPPPPEANCDEVSVEDIYDDGKILSLLDGRRLSVADYDTPTSGVWVAPFEGLICRGDRFINTDDDEGVDLEE